MIDAFTFTIVIVALVFNILNFFTLKNKHSKCDFPCYCKYSDYNIREILMDYDAEKAKELDETINRG